jgi:hypothetical protein
MPPYGYPSNYRNKHGYPPTTDTSEADNVVDGVDNVQDGGNEVTD